MSDLDGELSNVNPALLALCQDPDAWREQRRRAMREKIYGQSPQGGAGPASAAHADSYMPTGGARDGAPPSTLSNPTSNSGAPRSQAERESYVLQQILSRKRTREQEQQSAAAAQAPASTGAPTQSAPTEPTLSMRDRILQKYQK